MPHRALDSMPMSDDMMQTLHTIALRINDIDERTKRTELSLAKLEEFPGVMKQLLSETGTTNSILKDIALSIKQTLREQNDAIVGKGQVPMKTHLVTVAVIACVALVVCVMGIIAVSYFTRSNIEGTILGFSGRIQHQIEKEAEQTRKEVKAIEEQIEAHQPAKGK